MIQLQSHKLYAPLRISIIALWMLSLIGAGVSPLYYVASPSDSEQSANISVVQAGLEQFDSKQTATPLASKINTSKELALRFTHNPFKITSTSENLDRATTDQDRGMTHNAPSGSPVTLWFVSAGTIGTVGATNSLKHHQQLESTDVFTERRSIGALTAASTCSEHPTKSFSATLLGQKPSGVS